MIFVSAFVDRRAAARPRAMMPWIVPPLERSTNGNPALTNTSPVCTTFAFVNIDHGVAVGMRGRHVEDDDRVAVQVERDRVRERDDRQRPVRRGRLLSLNASMN